MLGSDVNLPGTAYGYIGCTEPAEGGFQALYSAIVGKYIPEAGSLPC